MANNEEEMSNSIMAIRYKIVFVGDIYVGKTSIMKIYRQQQVLILQQK